MGPALTRDSVGGRGLSVVSSRSPGIWSTLGEVALGRQVLGQQRLLWGVGGPCPLTACPLGEAGPRAGPELGRLSAGGLQEVKAGEGLERKRTAVSRRGRPVWRHPLGRPPAPQSRILSQPRFPAAL